MSTDGWYTIVELAVRTGRKPNSIRRHLIPKWRLDGRARMVNGQWEVNQEAFDELAECVRRCNIRAEQKKDKPATLPLPIAGPADPKAIDEAEKMPYPNGDVEQLVQRIIDGSPKKPGTSPVDELGFQTIYAHPHAKCIRIVTPHTAVLINLQPKLPKTV